MPTKSHKGSSFDSFLEEENILENSEAVAIKRTIAYQLEKAMHKKHLTKSTMATKMRTSRSALDRLLDPENTSITLNTLVRAFHVLGKEFRISFR